MVYSLLLQGEDVLDFFQRMTVTKFTSSFEIKQPKLTAFLDKKSRIEHYGYLIRLDENQFEYLVTSGNSEEAQQKLEAFIFAEDIDITPGCRTSPFVEKKKSMSDSYRVKNHLPLLGRDITDKDLFLETPLAPCFDRGKGCFPGQEVVERILSYGRLNEEVVAIKLSQAQTDLFDDNTLFNSEDQRIGALRHLVEDPDLGMIGFAKIKTQVSNTRMIHPQLGEFVRLHKKE